MKKILVLFVFVMCAYVMHAQKTLPGSFRIINNNDPGKTTFIEEAILKSNMEIFRLQDKDVILHFENGFDLELLSAKSFFFKGGSINPKSYQETSNLEETKPTFNLNENGIVVVMYKSRETKSKKNNN